ncbi:efflux RND transporter periplasmic adaptor subunit [Candidatus Ferrigenium straubiae]|jgi:Cu(I)/Ag(I) efflux system membrane fusion protein|uniref:efflux RND transporter periplasmic adaptor subunit n=1 Tax=Candidatus Ferrigenium straubiae TaxID=2919506 RepID=UPI003F4AC413
MAQPEEKQDSRLPDAPAFWRAKLWLGLGAIAALTVGGYLYLGHSANRPGGNASAAHLDQITAPDKAKPAKKLYVCPMHPQVIRDQPDELCPICGMDLVELDQPGASPAEHNHGVFIDTASQQRLGVRLAAAEWQTLSQDIHAYGNVIADESLVFNLSSKLEGVIKKLHVNSVGQQVEEGDAIYEIYSPELFKIQFEYVDVIKEKDKLMVPMASEDAHTNPDYRMTESEMMAIQMNAKMRNLYTEKFQYFDAGQLIEELNTSYRPREVVEIRAPRSGFITKIDIREGSAIKPMDNLLSFANTSRVWIDVPLYPDQLAWVKNGDAVAVKPPKSNAPEIKARLQFITPMVDSATRTVQARLSVDNPGNRLLIGSFLDVIIHTKPHKALAVPRSAVMRSGKGDWVMRSDGKGHFTPTRVETGIEASDSIEIIAGLQAGDQIAVNGQFLLDAAASMSDAAQRMQHDDKAGKH